jgi:hypothetical protein
MKIIEKKDIHSNLMFLAYYVFPAVDLNTNLYKKSIFFITLFYHILVFFLFLHFSTSRSKGGQTLGRN